MSGLKVIVPSRGRPHAALELADAFALTCTADTSLIFAVDTDDPAKAGYTEVAKAGLASVITGDHTSMVDALNQRATGYAGLEDDLTPFAIAFMGDDHRPRTVGWDAAYLKALADLGTGIVYGDDLLQGERLPTQCAMTADIVRALGYMAPPTLTHLAVDDAWLALGHAADCIRYLPDVVVEHLHPVAGKAGWDAGYRRVNSQAMYRRDLLEFERWKTEELPAAAVAVRALRGVAA